MKKISMNIPCSIETLTVHHEIKNKLLTDILSAPLGHNVTYSSDNTDITRCDWNHAREKDRVWVKTLLPALTNHLSLWAVTMGFKSFMIRDLWFQQYELGSQHDWHTHGCNWTGVYFLDIPDNSEKTKFKDPMNTEIENEFDVSEGDILIFPSFVIHKAPTNNNQKTKTIISWNMETILTPEEIHIESQLESRPLYQ